MDAKSKAEILNRKLKEVGLKLTKVRAAIIASMCKMEKLPFTVDELFKCMKCFEANVCDRASLYRNLKKFENAGLIRRCDIFGDTAYFDLCESDGSVRKYIRCRACGRLDTVELKNEVEIRNSDFEKLSYKVEVSGICSNCLRACK